MARSMTGYASHQGTVGKGAWTFELRSVNHRFLDLNLRMPSRLNPFEADIRKVVDEVTRRNQLSFIADVSGIGEDPEMGGRGDLTELIRAELRNTIYGDQMGPMPQN